jgi:hypothetical protein
LPYFEHGILPIHNQYLACRVVYTTNSKKVVLLNSKRASLIGLEFIHGAHGISWRHGKYLLTRTIHSHIAAIFNYYALVYPYLQYCVTVWGSTYTLTN